MLRQGLTRREDGRTEGRPFAEDDDDENAITFFVAIRCVHAGLRRKTGKAEPEGGAEMGKGSQKVLF